MSPVRFQIGVPRAGSAARSSEGAYASPENDGWTRAKKVALSGSAARAVEERKRAEGLQAKQGASIALRATGGAVVDRETMMRESAAPGSVSLQETYSREKPVISSDFPLAERISTTHTGSAGTVPSLTEHSTQDTSVQPGLLQSAAARFHSLTRSLFQRKEASS